MIDQEDLLRYARRDMRLARERNGILIAQTKRGTVALDYDRAAKRYSIISQDGGTWRRENLAAKEAASEIAGLYVVVYE